MAEYEVAVIGGGPGGYVAAIKAAQAGKKTIIIEQEHFGGTCLNVGCIPTKAMVKSVGVMEEIRRASTYGIEGVDASKVRVSMPGLMQRKEAVVKQLVGGVQGLLKGNGVTIINGTAAFSDAHTLTVNGKTVTTDAVIIATGSESVMPKFLTYGDPVNLITSTEALSLQEIPESMTIIGGGVIGVEFAYVYASLGTKVTVVELMEDILPMVDAEIARTARKLLEKRGVTFLTGAKVERIVGRRTFFEYKGKKESVEAAYTLMAVGRAPFTGGLNLEAAGVETDRGAVLTDEHMRTNVKHIYAIGDVNGKSMLAHTASKEGEVAVENILGRPVKMSYDAIPSCIYMEPEIASVGLTEEAAKKQYGHIKVGRFPMSANGKSLIEGETSGMLKVILDAEYHRILGVHMLCAHATDMIAEIVTAMTLESCAEEVIESVHPHPTVSEAVGEAFMAAVDRAVHAL